MKTGPSLALLAACLVSILGCDDHPAAHAGGASSSSRPAAAAASRPSETRRISLLAIPFTAAVPNGWDVRSGAGGKVVLNGRLPDGNEVDVLLTPRDRVKAEALPALLAKLQQAQPSTTSADPGAPTSRVIERDNLKIVEQTERLGPTTMPVDLVPFQWTLQVFVAENPLEYAMYELNVTDLTQSSFDRNAPFLRAIFDSLQYDRAAVPEAR